MNDDKFIKELKELATRKKLPTAESLGMEYEHPLKEELTNMNEISEEGLQENELKSQISTEEKTKPKEIIREVKEENIFEKVENLYKEGKTLDEIYHILTDQGYNYETIEEAILALTKKESEIEKIKTLEIEKPMEDIKKKVLEEKPIFEDREYAPLFIKVEKYKEALETIENLENYLKGMSKLFELVNKIEKIRTTNLNALTQIYKKALATASKLYSGLLKPKGIKFEGELVSEVELQKLDSVINDLNKELELLKEEIDNIKSIE